jgi:hypothetical protein
MLRRDSLRTHLLRGLVDVRILPSRFGNYLAIFFDDPPHLLRIDVDVSGAGHHHSVFAAQNARARLPDQAPRAGVYSPPLGVPSTKRHLSYLDPRYTACDALAEYLRTPTF